MKKIIPILLLLATILVAFVIATGENYIVPATEPTGISPTQWRGQNFQVRNGTMILSTVQLWMNSSTKGNITVLIQHANATGVPNGTNVSFGNIIANFDSTPSFRTIIMNPVTLNNNSNYTIIVFANQSTSGLFYNITGSYPFGNATASNDRGLTWFNLDGDAPFIISSSGGPSSILVELTSPPNGAVFSSSSGFFSATITPTNTNLTNATLYIYNSTSTFAINFTNLSGNVPVTVNRSISGLANGNYLWNYLVWGKNLTNGNFSAMASANFSFEIGATIISQNYSNFVYETSNQTFSININLLPGIELSLAQLVYNGTNYTVSDVSSFNTTGRTLTREIDIPVNPVPLTNTVRNFFWRFTFSNSQQTVQETSPVQQEVGFINLQICDTTYNVKTLNFTLYDETTLSPINAITNNTSISSFYQYWAGTGEVKKNYSVSFTNNASNYFIFCIYPTNMSFRSNLDMEYSAVGYSPRQYYLRNATLTNVSVGVPLYLLSEELAVKFFNTVTQGTNFVNNSIVQISKFYISIGGYQQIGVRLTDELGEFIEYLDLDQPYRYTVIKNGQVIGVIDKTALCAQAPCEQTLEIGESIANINDAFDEFYAENVLYSLNFNSTTNIVSFIFTDTTGLANYFRLQVDQVLTNDTSNIICNSELAAPSGTINCNVTGYQGEFRASGYVSRSPEKLVDFINFVVSQVSQIFGGISIWLSLLVVVTLVFVGVWNPVVMVILIPIALIILKLMQFVPFGWPTIVVITLIAIYLAGRIKT